jgi:calcium-dependent protein kinase
MRDYYKILDPPLGKGAYGEVRQCIYLGSVIDKNSTVKKHRAVKILSKAYMEEKDIQYFKREVFCLKLLDHPNI